VMDKVIIDTSAWIESFRPGSEKSFQRLVKDLIIQDLVLLPGIIKTELLRGTKNKKEFNQLNQMLKGLAYLAVDEDFWERLSNFSFQLFRKGITVPLTDTYIALLCIENHASLLHRDKHFDMIAKKTKLSTIKRD
jgi:predicted nucleic acid-binding protein